ncbi:peptide/nickel transport system permease protein [Evansella vedderi]|uniref:Peptide/nickel transport system permease protein n=1 Tax=Evansella vedderi TaxID=38282 RepID=A0ABT9ZZM7_9BACI|nr:peptide/nickel transport system permease protein [Evansella vedderi]
MLLPLLFLKKFIRLASLLFAVCILSFFLVNKSPVDPIQAYVGADMMRVGPEQREKIAEHWGLDKTPVEQFYHWSSAIVRGDFGTSMIYRQPVLDVIKDKFIYSFALMLAAWILSGVIGFLLGIIAAVKRDSWIDRLIKLYCYTLASTPAFWIGILLLLIFAVGLGWLPIGLGVPAGVLTEEVTVIDRVRHFILPAITLSIVGVVNVALHTRQKLIDVLQSDYVLFARARGEKGFSLIWRHGIRNIALPALTLQFAAFGELFGGAVLVELVFSYPGLGQATVEAGLRGDVPLLLGLVIFSTLFVFIGNLLADLIYLVVDPRTKEREAI